MDLGIGDTGKLGDIALSSFPAITYFAGDVLPASKLRICVTFLRIQKTQGSTVGTFWMVMKKMERTVSTNILISKRKFDASSHKATLTPKTLMA